MKVYVIEEHNEGYEGIYATLEAAKKTHGGTWKGPFDHRKYTVGDTVIVEECDCKCWDHPTESLSIYEEELLT